MSRPTCRFGDLPVDARGEFTTLMTGRRGLVLPPRDAPAHPDGIRVGLEPLRGPAGRVGAQTGLQTDDPADPWPVESWLHRNVRVAIGWPTE